jgi:hypothetical protein
MNHGGRTFTRDRIEGIRDAEDWPDNPPTSLVREARGRRGSAKDAKGREEEEREKE